MPELRHVLAVNAVWLLTGADGAPWAVLAAILNTAFFGSSGHHQPRLIRYRLKD
ncbi:hypothetical protein [Mycobacterium kiyosense]|jgi:hypothetical protein|uniref:hypothetical protein n=1 Tax=Mycobacterium kiyosense TaxID=2871094 RepID=UPI002230B069|nr:hypothetical protein [Mycobacterium kiyosense]